MDRRIFFLFVAALLMGTAAASQDQTSSAAGADKPPANAAEDLFKQKCAMCHQAQTTTKTVGPGLQGLSKRNFVTTNDPVTDDGIRKWIVQGDGKMPPFGNKLTPAQIDGLVLYLDTL